MGLSPQLLPVAGFYEVNGNAVGYGHRCSSSVTPVTEIIGANYVRLSVYTRKLRSH